MTTHSHSTTRRSIGRALRHLWQDTTNASRAQFRLPPYDDYLQHHRDTHR